MTLIFSVGNSDQVIQLSDRRLSSNGKIWTEEANKAAVIHSAHARLALGFTGLAKAPGFDTFSWLLKELHLSAAPDFNISNTINRFVLRISDAWCCVDELKNVDSKNMELSLIFSGYIYPNGEPKLVFCVASNSFDTSSGYRFNAVQNTFNVCFYENNDGDKNPVFVRRIGNWRGILSEDELLLREACSRRLPTNAIVEIGVKTVCSIAKRARSSKTIGRKISSIVIPADITKSVHSNYHSAVIKPETYLPDIVYLFSDQQAIIQNISVTPVDADTPPLSVPKVRRKLPCPCGSKLSYRDCHGRR